VKAYPAKGERLDVDRAQLVWARKKLSLHAPQILRAVERASQSADWLKNGGQYVPKFSRFLEGGVWRVVIDAGTGGETGAPRRNGEIIGPDGLTASERQAYFEEERRRAWSPPGVSK
jgi:hypothetical protein